ncbi:MAG: hypothetical protein JW843_06170 [Candidatus Aminicenantes bacterium]|nr:hypothetical protein [Candidatus Aminicenantes bacterium]
MRKTFCLLCILGLSVAAAAQPAEFKAPQPVFVSSCGQSMAPTMMKVILQKAGLTYSIEPLATAAELKAAGAKTLIVTMGASLKGMGAAGIAIDNELTRVAALIAEARKMKLTVIGAHIEGMKRRAQGADGGDTTDEQSIDAVAPLCDALIVLKEGNSDNRFSTIAKAKNIPLIEVDKNLDLVARLEKIFK